MPSSAMVRALEAVHVFIGLRREGAIDLIQTPASINALPRIPMNSVMGWAEHDHNRTQPTGSTTWSVIPRLRRLVREKIFRRVVP